MTEAVKTEEKPAFEIPAAAVPIVDLIKNAAEAANALATQVKESKAGADLRINEALNNSDDKKITEWRAWDEKVRKQAEENRAAIVKYVQENLLSDLPEVNVEEITKQYLSKRQEITAFEKTLKVLVGNSDENVKAAKEVAGIVEIVNLRGGGAHSGAVVGSSKPRFASGVVGDKTYAENPTLTQIAKDLGVDLDVLRKGFFDAIGTQDWQSKAGETVTFSIVNKKNETVSVSLVPRKDTRTTEK